MLPHPWEDADMLSRSIVAFVVLLGCVSPVLGQLSEQLFITEVMWDSSHPGSNDLGEGGHANGDWFELFNASDMTIDMSGFQWDDDNRRSDPDGVTIFPDDFAIGPEETILIVREDDETLGFADGFRAAWNLPQELRIFGRDTFADGPEGFSGLGSGGDEINLYDASGTLIQSAVFGASTEGFTTAWGFDNGSFVDLGLSVDGENGAYTATSDGSNGRLLRDANGSLVRDNLGNTVVDPNSDYVPDALDIGSPGVVFGFGDVVVEDVITVCNLVALGERTEEDLDAALAAAGSLRGDVDLDGTVGFADFLIHASSFGQTSENGFAGGWQQGDFNCDGNVVFADFLLLASNFGLSGSDSLAAVPEPQSHTMFLAAAMLALGLRRKKSW